MLTEINPQPKSTGKKAQGVRLAATFDGLSRSIEAADREVIVSDNPNGILPDKALVFELASNLNEFARVAKKLAWN